MMEVVGGFAILAALPLFAGGMAVWIRRVRGEGALRVRLVAALMGLAATGGLAVVAYQAVNDPMADRLYLASPLFAFLAGLLFTPSRRDRQRRYA